jgi:CheY-like chemotaxis protein
MATAQLVVVIEDDPPTAALLTDVLTDAGYRVTVLEAALGVPEAVQRL